MQLRARPEIPETYIMLLFGAWNGEVSYRAMMTEKNSFRVWGQWRWIHKRSYLACQFVKPN